MLNSPLCYETDEEYRSYVRWAEDALEKDAIMYAQQEEKRLAEEGKAAIEENARLRTEIVKLQTRIAILQEENKRLSGLAGVAILDWGPFRHIFGG
jgi:hypothetical protein